MDTQRLDFLDFGKAMAILGVLCVHICASGFPSVNNYALFLIPVFFVVAGYTYNPEKRTTADNIRARFTSLMPTFWKFMLLYIVVELVREPWFGYGSPKMAFSALINAAYGSGFIPNAGGLLQDVATFIPYKTSSPYSVDLITPTNCMLWFLPAMFTGCVLFYVLEKISRTSTVVKVLVVAGLVLCASLESVIPQIKQLPYGLGRGFFGAAYMLMGFWMNQYGLFRRGGKSLALAMFGLCLCLAALAGFLGSTGSAYVASYYGPYGIASVYLTFVGGVAATCCVLYICRGIEHLHLPSVTGALSRVGRSTMTIYCWHMVFIFMLDALYFGISGKPTSPDEFNMALLPADAWWYMLFEIVVVASLGTCLHFFKAQRATAKAAAKA